jgi:hypothetical protein
MRPRDCLDGGRGLAYKVLKYWKGCYVGVAGKFGYCVCSFEFYLKHGREVDMWGARPYPAGALTRGL